MSNFPEQGLVREEGTVVALVNYVRSGPGKETAKELKGS